MRSLGQVWAASGRRHRVAIERGANFHDAVVIRLMKVPPKIAEGFSSASISDG